MIRKSRTKGSGPEERTAYKIFQTFCFFDFLTNPNDFEFSAGQKLASGGVAH